MSIRRYAAEKDTTITNAFRSNLSTRGTGSNMGESDILEVFGIYAQASSASHEAARILIQFPVNEIQTDRTAGLIPTSGSVSFYLRLFNAEHGETVPRQFTLNVLPVSRSWEEGTGLDMEEYLDITRDGQGANWIRASQASAWSQQGGDYISGSFTKSQYFEVGVEDLEINVTDLIELNLNGTITNNGVGIHISSSQENASRSYFTKRFFARGSEFFYKRPHIEARWDAARKDHRGRFELSSTLKTASDNLQTLYLYNYVRGTLRDIPNIGQGSPIFVTLHPSSSGADQITTSPVTITGTWADTGIYSASFALNTTSSVVYDRWFSGSVYYHTGSFEPISHDASDNVFQYQTYMSNITNLKPAYSDEENGRFRLFVRQKNLTPTLFTVASAVPENHIIEDAYFKIFRLTDDCDIIPYGTGSTQHTRLSYDKDGNYFGFDMSVLETGYMYGFKFVYLLNDVYEEQPEVFKFRVEQPSL